jgi:glycosyltransferase involved in cell wall biosynthesis
MHLVFFTHPSFLGHQSMPRFARMLADGMTVRGHSVEVWSPSPKFFKGSNNPFIKKWLSYIDQYIVFPGEVRRKARHQPQDTLFVFTDQALGPWVPLLANRPHVIHCHDFMALRSAQGEIPENPTGWTGKRYQHFIKRGFSMGQHFVSVSKKTKTDLHKYLPREPKSSDVVYNGFHQPFFPEDVSLARKALSEKINLDLTAGYILHVGGNQWYKNRTGVIDIYDAWRSMQTANLPLLFMGEKPSNELLRKHNASSNSKDIHWLTNIDDRNIQSAYSGASVFLFPSLGEGFGWPIAEAMASGCPVITTDEAPMNEVAADAGFLVPKQPSNTDSIGSWARNVAAILQKVINLSPSERAAVIAAGIINAKRFDTQVALNSIERIYLNILETEKSKR